MIQEQFTVDYFISKFEAIPEQLWCIGDYTKEITKHCALGHCGVERFMPPTKEAKALEELFSKIPTERIRPIVDINDGTHKEYQQPTPKQRILAALYDIKNRQK